MVHVTDSKYQWASSLNTVLEMVVIASAPDTLSCCAHASNAGWKQNF